MPDQSSAAQEHALLQEITEPLKNIPDDAVHAVADAHFPTVLRGYDKLAVDDYIRETSQLVAELQSRSSPQAAVRRALERVGEDVSGILQRAHETAEGITAQSRREAEDRLEVARVEAAKISADAQVRVKELDADTDRIWAERDRIVADARELARQLLELADAAAARFPAADEPPARDSGDTDGFVPAAGAEAAEATEAFTPFSEDDEHEELTQAFTPLPETDAAASPETRVTWPQHPPAQASTPPIGPFDVDAPDSAALPGEPLNLTPPAPRPESTPRPEATPRRSTD